MDPELAPKAEPRATPVAVERASEIDDLLDVEVRDGAPGSPLHRRRLVRRIAAAAGGCVLVAAALASLQDHGVEKHDGAARDVEHANAAPTHDDVQEPATSKDATAAHDDAASERRASSDATNDDEHGTAKALDAENASDVAKNGRAKRASTSKSGAKSASDAAESATTSADAKKPASTKERSSKGRSANDSTAVAGADAEPAARPKMTAAELRDARREIDRELKEAAFELEQGDAPAARRRWYALLARADGIDDAELRNDIEARAGFAIARSYSSTKETSR